MTVVARARIEAQEPGLIGRESERATLRLVLERDGPAVVFVHGIGGVGKSALLETFMSDARARGAVVISLDGGAVEPTPRGFLAALSSATGSDLESAEDAVARLARLGALVVLTVDRYEVLRPIDLWLQQDVVPALPDNVRLVVAGREPPMAGWPMALGRRFRGLPLGNLPRAEAEVLLRRDGVTGDDIERINWLARGHPLSLRMAAAALVAQPARDHDATTVTAIVDELTELYLAGLDPATREALDAASVVRRPTISLLSAMLPDAAPQDAFDRLRVLPFVDLTSDGLAVHDTVREGVAAYLRASDPDRLRRYRIAAWRQLRDEVGRASPQEMWRYTADLLFILQNPMIREAFFPTTEHLYFVEGARPADWPAIEALGAAQEAQASVAILSEWWRRDPERFRVARNGDGAVAGCYVVGELDRVKRGLLDVDPVARRWRDHLRQDPVPRGQRVLFDRFELVRDDELVLAAIMLDLKRMYLELRPELRRIYTVGLEPMAGTAWERLGFEARPRRAGQDRWRGLPPVAARLRTDVGRRLAHPDHRDRAADRGGHGPRSGAAPARARRAAGRPHEARVRGVRVPLRAPRAGGRAVVPAARRLGLRLRRRRQRDRGADHVAATEARRPCRVHRDRPWPGLSVRRHGLSSRPGGLTAAPDHP